MVNLDPKRTAYLNAALADCANLELIKRTAYARAKAQVDAEIHAAMVTASVSANRAITEGVPKSHFLKAKAIGTSDGGTFNDFLALTRQAQPIVDAANPTGQFIFNPETQVLMVRATDQKAVELLRAAGVFGWTWDQIIADPTLSSATFTVEPYGLNPVTPEVQFMQDRADRHPVIALVLSDPALESAALEWVRKQPGYKKEA